MNIEEFRAEGTLNLLRSETLHFVCFKAEAGQVSEVVLSQLVSSWSKV